MSYTQSIVTEIRRKTSGGFETPVKLGADQRFVSALLNSHNNNLEEQSILGVDCLETSWSVNDIDYVTKKFYNGDLTSVSNKGYYILFITDYTNSEATADYYFESDGIYFPVYETSGASFDENSDGNFALLCDKREIYSFDEDGQSLKVNPSFRVMRKEVLCLRTDLSNTSDEQINSDVLISEKVITRKIGDDGKTFTRTIITNHLSD